MLCLLLKMSQQQQQQKQHHLVPLVTLSISSLLLLLLSLSYFPPPVAAIVDDINALQNAAAGSWSDFKMLLGVKKGESRDEIPHLKAYFSQFGYLRPIQNATKDFDDMLEAAIKLYQQSFHLPVTGSLDVPTLWQIITPRCGREDVADGIPLMIQPVNRSTASSSSSSPTTTGDNSPPVHAGGVVARYTYFPGSPKWPDTQRSLAYAFSPGDGNGGVNDEQLRKQIFNDAFQTWASVMDLGFVEIENVNDADIVIEFVGFEHGDGEAFDGSLGVLAHAFSPTDGRFHLDQSEYWAVLGESLASEPPQAIDLQTVVLHEIGHLIGLGHSSVEDAIMYPSIAPRQVKIKLHSDDVLGAQSLYGTNPSYDPNNTNKSLAPTTSQHLSVSCPTTKPTPFALLLLLLFLLLRVEVA